MSHTQGYKIHLSDLRMMEDPELEIEVVSEAVDIRTLAEPYSGTRMQTRTRTKIAVSGTAKMAFAFFNNQGRYVIPHQGDYFRIEMPVDGEVVDFSNLRNRMEAWVRINTCSAVHQRVLNSPQRAIPDGMYICNTDTVIRLITEDIKRMIYYIEYRAWAAPPARERERRPITDRRRILRIRG